MRRSWWWFGCLMAGLCTASSAAQTRASLLVEVVPMLGRQAPIAEGWSACAVRLANTGPTELEGTLELAVSAAWDDDQHPVTTAARFHAPAQGRVTLELPIHGLRTGALRLTARALDQNGQELASVELPEARPTEPIVVDLAAPSRIAPALRDARLMVGDPRRPARFDSPTVTISTPELDPASGELTLPVRPSGYAAASLVLVPTETLLRLSASRLEALADWVLAGGSVALTVTRPDDLRTPTLQALLGGTAARDETRDDLGQSRDFDRPLDPLPGNSGRRRPAKRVERAQPAPAVFDALTGYQGGNLRRTQWGSAASYGLGEVHLLAFDAMREPAVSDPWVKLELLELVRHAWLRQRHVAFRSAARALDWPVVDQVRRQLDPNEGTRWSVGVAALVLLLYALIAGPVNFYLASRRGHALRALLRLPLISALALGLVVVLGTLAKGVSGRARRLALVEAGAGMSRASIVRFRGFFAPSSAERSIRASDPRSVLDVAGTDASAQRRIAVDRDGVRLTGLGAGPWETVVVREDGFVTLGNGVLVFDRGGVEVRNLTGRELRSVIVKPPRAQARYFASIAPGQTVRADAGVLTPGLSGIGVGVVNFQDRVDTDRPGLGAAWQALEAVADSDTWWWPDDVPVLIAEVTGGEGRVSDAGLTLEADRMLIRVVGWGGAP